MIYNSPPGQRKVRKHFNQSLRLCYAAMNQLFKGQNSWTAASERLWMISHQNIEHIERYIPEPMKLGFKFFFLICVWLNLGELCSKLNCQKNNKAWTAVWYNGDTSTTVFITKKQRKIWCQHCKIWVSIASGQIKGLVLFYNPLNANNSPKIPQAASWCWPVCRMFNRR